MIFSKIFKIFLLFLLILLQMPYSEAGSFSLNNICELEFTPTNELISRQIMEYAKEINSNLEKIFPKHRQIKKHLIRKFRIIFTDDTGNYMDVKQQNRNITITIGGLTPDFPGNYTFLHNFFSAITLQAMPYENEKVSTSWKLPHWVFLGLHSKIKNTFTGQKIFRSSRSIPGVRIFLEMDFFPDPILTESCNGEKMSNIEIFFMQDYCRLLLDLCTMFAGKSPNPTGIYLREIYLQQNISDPAVFQRVIMRFLQKHAQAHIKRMLDDPACYNEKQQMDIFLKFHAGHLAFSYSSPASSNYLRKRFEQLKKIRFTEVNDKKKPTGKIIESSIEKFPELVHKHSNCREVLQLKRGELLYFRSIASSFFSAEINHLIELLGNVKDSIFFGTSSREIRNACSAIEKRMDEFEKIEKFLEKTETAKLSPFQIFPYEFSIEKEHRNAAVPASFLDYLEKNEKSYLK